MNPRGEQCGWWTTFEGFTVSDPAEILESLRAFVGDAGPEQDRAWREAIPLVRDAALEATESHPPSAEHGLIMEYRLPREGNRRPDLVLLENGAVVVLELKGKDSASLADLDQVAAYARDLRNYHSATHGRQVLPVLVPTRYRGPRQSYDDVEVLSPRDLAKLMVEVSRASTGQPVPPERWSEAEYSPLPSLVEAARQIFMNRPLPFVRRAQSTGIPEAISTLADIAHRAANENTRHLVLLTGVPGAGKTLVGLQFVHDSRLEDLVVRNSRRVSGAPAVFLSGNGPLVQVLRHALHGEAGEEKVFVEGIKNYLKQYSIRRDPRVPPEHILVFDEAQRAWDAVLIEEKHGVKASEPELVLRLAAGIPGWAMVLGLVGEGQEIYKGEEAGIGQWADAVHATPEPAKWVVHGPAKLSPSFAERRIPFEPTDRLDLTVTLRSHLSSRLHDWVAGLLSSDASIDSLNALAGTIRREGFKLYLTRALADAAEYARERYENQTDKRYGLVASSRAKNLTALGIDNDFQATKQLRVGPWYNDDPRSPFSCCQLRTVATEFQAQGLELDLPIVCWGDDFYRENDRWVVAPRRLGKVYRDPKTLRVNSYRVLLTRGRDGLVVFVPPDRGDGMDATARYLLACGLRRLDNRS